MEWLYRLDPDFKSEDEEDEPDENATNLIYQFKITLKVDVDPPIWRRLQISSCSTFRQLHLAVQRTMGWQSYNYDYHLHQFKIINPRTGFWNTIGESYDLTKDENKTYIQKYFPRALYKCSYVYDLSFGWEHEIVLEDFFEAVPGLKYPRCVGGARACPPEDVGGLGGGYGDFVEAIKDLAHPNYGEFQEWLGGDFDPDFFDPNSCFIE